ncbi:MAG: hypothetical protein ACK5LJ_15815 [Paracoccus sp. (in: a-proteobacteria)]
MNVEEFGELTDAERRLLAHLRNGWPGVFCASDSTPPEYAMYDRHIRATLIRGLILGKIEGCPLPDQGLRIWGAFIRNDGENDAMTRGLDLEGVTLSHDLSLFSCRFPDPVLLRGARVNNLYLNHSVFASGIRADGLEAAGCLFLRDITSEGELSLPGARIGGDLSLSRARLPQMGIALGADGVMVRGSVFLRNMLAGGEVRLLGAQVAGSLDCEGMVLSEPGAKDVPAIPGAPGQGSAAPGFVSMSADGIELRGGLLLRNSRIAGELRLPGARIGGDLDCEGAILSAPGMALNSDGAQITGTWFWRNGAKSLGTIDMNGARIGAIDDDPACWPDRILLNRCQYGALVGTGVSGAARRDWLARSTPPEGRGFWSQPYEECARVLRAAGLGADARGLMIEKERRLRQVRHQQLGQELGTSQGFFRGTGLFFKRWLLWFWDRIAGLTLAYGCRPYQALVPMLLLLLFGAWVFGRAADQGAIRPVRTDMQSAVEWADCANPPERQPECFLQRPGAMSYPRFNSLIYSADTLIPAIPLGMQSYWAPDDRKLAGDTAQSYLWVHIALGWTLIFLALAGFAGLISSDEKT